MLTRIDPLRPITSMIMRIRPGWEELRSYLAPDPKKSGPGVSRCVALCRVSVFAVCFVLTCALAVCF